MYFTRTRRPIAAISASLTLAALPSFAPALSAQSRAPSAVRAIGISVMGPDVVVTIDADGPLPAPTVGAVDGPPRIFLDLVGVRTKAPAATPSSDPRIRRVRVALNSAQPLVTRVVLDLPSLQPHRIEQRAHQLRIVLGPGGAPTIPNTVASAPPPPAPVPPAPVAPAPAPPAPPPANASTARPPRTPPPQPSAAAPDRRIAPVPPLPDAAPAAAPEESGRRAAAPPSSAVASYKPLPEPPSLRDVERYRAQVLGTLERFRNQMPVLESLEDRSERTTELMELAGLEIDRLKQELIAVKPPETLRVQHDLLLQSARLAGMAIRLRAEALQNGNSTIMRNAASAAAGAVLMFDRACAEVGCANDR